MVMVEKERKYLPDLSKTPPPIRIHYIQQAYIFTCKSGHIRVRIINEKASLLTDKIKRHFGEGRYEFEYYIGNKFAKFLFKLAKNKLSKIRYYFVENEKEEIIMDEYQNGLCVVEIEYKDNLEIIPDYCIYDVTNDPQYSNQYLAKQMKYQKGKNND